MCDRYESCFDGTIEITVWNFTMSSEFNWSTCNCFHVWMQKLRVYFIWFSWYLVLNITLMWISFYYILPTIKSSISAISICQFSVLSKIEPRPSLMSLQNSSNNRGLILKISTHSQCGNIRYFYPSNHSTDWRESVILAGIPW